MRKGRMHEKNYFCLVVAVIIVAVILGGAVGFLVGRGNSVRPVEFERTNRELTATVGELRTELDRERTITEGLRSKQDEERVLIGNALDACRRAGGGVQGVIAKMEILNDLIRGLESRAGGGAGISGGE
ncbi:MAG: hypothetical protein LBH20_04095 [Treponema sp.]|jgi:hypothetical protein|nr:hypothetical protein [Treponema sp.]